MANGFSTERRASLTYGRREKAPRRAGNSDTQGILGRFGFPAPKTPMAPVKTAPAAPFGSGLNRVTRYTHGGQWAAAAMDEQRIRGTGLPRRSRARDSRLKPAQRVSRPPRTSPGRSASRTLPRPTGSTALCPRDRLIAFRPHARASQGSAAGRRTRQRPGSSPRAAQAWRTAPDDAPEPPVRSR